MKFSILHRLPGRIRLRVADLQVQTPLADKMLAWLRRQDGIRAVRANFDCASLVVEYDEAQRESIDAMLDALACFTLKQLKSFIALAGDEAPAPAASPHAKPAPQTGLRILAAPTLSLGLALSSNPFLAIINIPLMLWNAFPIGKRAWRVLSQEKRLNVDFLDTIAIAASIVQGLMLTGGIIVWLIRLGDWIRDLTAAGSKRAIAQLMDFQTRTAWLLCDGQVVSVPALSLQEGDCIIVYPGEVIPVDGEILAGGAMIDQKTITGESLPVSRAQGEAVYAATVVREGQITVRAMRVGVHTTAGQIAQLVDSTPVGDTRMQNHAERFADRLVLPTLSLAAGTAAVTADYRRFLSLVIVDYGTGIRVAAPTSMLSSITHAARAGIIVKSGGHMERLAGVDTVVFDKTGTLTHGTPEVVEVIPYDERVDARHLLGLAVAAETRLQHPVAEALRAHAQALGVEPPPCEETEFKVGLGVQGQVNGYYMHVGSERFLRDSNILVRRAARDRKRLDELGYSVLYVAIDGQLAGLIPYADRVRPESPAVVQKLRALGVRDTIMLTGDNAIVARAVGSRIGLTRQIADMMPADKAQVIEDLKREGRSVAMVGDGINDSVALTYADVGIAMRHGAEIAHESADIVLMEDSLWKLVKALEISRDAVGLIKQNYGIVGVLNTLALGLALPGGLVTPEFTAVLSNGSAIAASLNGMRPLMRGS
jgi:heavy metal translocating P-type ATPase